MSTLSQKAFSGGEISPSLYARTDVGKYYNSVKTMRNFFTMRHGGAQNRAGTKFICEVKDSTKRVRLIPFIFSRSVSYVLEFGNLYMRVIKNGAQVTNTAQNISAISNANPAVLTYVGADNYANGDEIVISGIVGPIGQYLNGRNFKVAGLDAGANTVQLNYLDGTPVNSTSFGAYTSGGTIAEVYTLTTTYVEANLQDLKFAQSGDVMTIVHPTYPPAELSRTADNAWAIADISINGDLNFNGFYDGASAPQGTPGTVDYTYAVTNVSITTGEESTGFSTVIEANGNATLSLTNFNRITWGAILRTDLLYNFYRRDNNGIFGYIGQVNPNEVNQFDDIGYTADATDNPPVDLNVFGSANDYPSTVTLYQQRKVYANTNNEPENVFFSKTGAFNSFNKSGGSVIQDDDAVEFTLAGKLISAVYNLVDIGRLIVFTESGEWIVAGGSAGEITPTQINARQVSYNGSKPSPSPLVINDSCLFVQARGSVVRDFNYKIESDGYTGNDITIFSSHLFDGFQINDWAFQQVPNSILWAVRSDGNLVACTYLKEQQMLAWHRHDTENGTFENIATIPGVTSQEDDVYFVIERTIDGVSKRYIEKLETRFISYIEDCKILDSHLTYDGTNLTATTMTLSGSGWTYTDTLTITSSAAYFSALDVGNEIHLTGADGSLVKFQLDAFSSSTVMTGRPKATVPVAMRATPIVTWGKAVDEIQGLWHLEGEDVSIFADGNVAANPNNDAYVVVTITNGMINLSEPAVVVHVGIPITSDIETLNIDSAQGETLADKDKMVTEVSLFVEASRGIWAGGSPPADESTDFLGGLYELKPRSDEPYNNPPALKTEVVDVQIESSWNSNGRVFIRQTDPVPLTVLAVYPSGRFPFRG